MAHYQSATRCNLEFLKSSKGLGKRIIKLNYGPGALPPQLLGRLDLGAWDAFINDAHQLSLRHPYVIKPKAGQYGEWALCFSIAAVLGCAAINPDGGSYPQWEAEVVQMLQRWHDTFARGGLALSLQQTREHWIQIDVVGPPPMAPPAGKGQEFGYQQEGGKLQEAPAGYGQQPQPYGQVQPYHPQQQQQQQPYGQQQQQQQQYQPPPYQGQPAPYGAPPQYHS